MINAADSTIFIYVENADGTTVISIEEPIPINPWPKLKLKQQTWRSINPCPNTLRKGDRICVDPSNNTYSIVWKLGTITSAEDCGC